MKTRAGSDRLAVRDYSNCANAHFIKPRRLWSLAARVWNASATFPTLSTVSSSFASAYTLIMEIKDALNTSHPSLTDSRVLVETRASIAVGRATLLTPTLSFATQREGWCKRHTMLTRAPVVVAQVIAITWMRVQAGTNLDYSGLLSSQCCAPRPRNDRREKKPLVWSVPAYPSSRPLQKVSRLLLPIETFIRIKGWTDVCDLALWAGPF